MPLAEPLATWRFGVGPARGPARLDAEVVGPEPLRLALSAFERSAPLAPHPILTVFDDALALEAFAADGLSALRVVVGFDALRVRHHRAGTAEILQLPDLGRFAPSAELVVDPTDQAIPPPRVPRPLGWVRSIATLEAAAASPRVVASVEPAALGRLVESIGRGRSRPVGGSVSVGAGGRVVAVADRPGAPTIDLGLAADGPTSSAPARAFDLARLGPIVSLLHLADRAFAAWTAPGWPTWWGASIGPVSVQVGLAAGRLDGRDLVEGLGPIAAAAGEASSLASRGQRLVDPSGGVGRGRGIGPEPWDVDRLDPEPTETVAARRIARTASVAIDREGPAGEGGSTRVEGTVLLAPAWLVVDHSGRIARGGCSCSHHARHRFDPTPCRHLQAIHRRRLAAPAPAEG